MLVFLYDRLRGVPRLVLSVYLQLFTPLEFRVAPKSYTQNRTWRKRCSNHDRLLNTLKAHCTALTTPVANDRTKGRLASRRFGHRISHKHFSADVFIFLYWEPLLLE